MLIRAAASTQALGACSLQENYGELEGLKARIGAVEVKSYVLP